MTDSDANPTKPIPHGGPPTEEQMRNYAPRPKRPQGPVPLHPDDYEAYVREMQTPCRRHIDPEQHITADEAERFTEEYAKRMGIK